MYSTQNPATCDSELSLREFIRQNLENGKMPTSTIHFSVLGFKKYFVSFNSLQLHFEQFRVSRSPLLPALYLIAVFFFHFTLYYIICTSRKYTAPHLVPNHKQILPVIFSDYFFLVFAQLFIFIEECSASQLQVCLEMYVTYYFILGKAKHKFCLLLSMISKHSSKIERVGGGGTLQREVEEIKERLLETGL